MEEEQGDVDRKDAVLWRGVSASHNGCCSKCPCGAAPLRTVGGGSGTANLQSGGAASAYTPRRLRVVQLFVVLLISHSFKYCTLNSPIGEGARKLSRSSCSIAGCGCLCLAIVCPGR